MKQHALNTLSRESALSMEKVGEQIARVVRIELRDVNEIITEYLPDCPNFVSLDAEGADIAILKSFDFDRFRPQVFCVETMDFETQEKTTEVLELMKMRDYTVFGETSINTIFVDQRVWSRRLA